MIGYMNGRAICPTVSITVVLHVHINLEEVGFKHKSEIAEFISMCVLPPTRYAFRVYGLGKH